MVPVPGTSYAEYLATPEATGAITMPMHRVARDDLGRSVVPPDVAREIFFPDCAAVDSERAIERLTPTRRRPSLSFARWTAGRTCRRRTCS